MVDEKQGQVSPGSHPSSSDSPETPYTFTQIIDADHLTIQSLAAKTRRVLSTIPSSASGTSEKEITTAVLPLLHEITWRLIRHDLSESLVMRPAFIATLPAPQGQEMADHDARDHANGRILLLSILERLEKGGDLREISERVIAAFDDLGKHMAMESGEFLPYFETLIDEAMSRRLAREYTESLCMTPYLRIPVPASDEVDGSEGCRQGAFKGVFRDVVAYVRMEPAELKAFYEDLAARAKVDEDLRARMRLEAQKEVDKLQVWKWRSLTMTDTGSKLATASQSENHRMNKL